MKAEQEHHYQDHVKEHKPNQAHQVKDSEKKPVKLEKSLHVAILSTSELQTPP